MKKEDYCRAVSEIQWSPEKKRLIERTLSQPADVRIHENAEHLFEEEKKRLKMQKKAQRKEKKSKESEVIVMKKEHKKRKLFLLIPAVALLAIGGTAAAVAYAGHKNRQEESLEDYLIENENPPDLENAVINPKLTNQIDLPECRQYAKTDSGFYFQGEWSTEHKVTLSNGNSYNITDSHKMLRYFDANTGKAVTVCAKANCLHDGNEFCVATTPNYEIISNYVYLDGYVYAVALDNIEYNHNPEGCTSFPTVLLRYAPDGTEVTAIATLRESEYQSSYYSYGNDVEMIAHRGQLWINLPYQEMFTVKDANMQIVSGETRGGYELYCYEPEAKKVTVLATTGEPQKGYNPVNFNGPLMKGIGDYVYYHKVAGDWRDPVKNSGIYRIDCRTGVIEQVLNLKREKSLYYAVVGDDIYYSFVTTSDSCYSYQNTTFYKYNMKTQETTELIPFFDLCLTQLDWLERDMITDDADAKARISIQKIIAANGYVYIPWYVNDLRNEDDTNDYNYITRFDAAGNYETVDLANAKGIELPEDYIRNEVKKNGYWNSKEQAFTEPEDLTEKDYQSALNDIAYSNSLIGSIISYDRGYFYFDTYRTICRMPAEELFGDMNAEIIFYTQE